MKGRLSRCLASPTETRRLIQGYFAVTVTIAITLDRYGRLYETDTQRLSNALDAAFATGLVIPETP